MTGAMYGTSMSDGHDDDPLTVREVAALLDVAVSNVRERLQSGKLRGWKDSTSGEWRVARSEVERYRLNRRRRPKLWHDADVLEDYQHQLGLLDDQMKDLIDQRNRCIFHLNQEKGASAASLARVTHMGRQSIYTIIREVRAQLAEEAARRRQ